MATKEPKNHKSELVAVHHKEGNKHAVKGNLRVLITPDDGMWFAQSLEIDYAAAGTSVEDVKERFQKGLALTIGEHLKMYGELDKFFVPSPPEVWKEFFELSSGKRFTLNFSIIAAPQIVKEKSPFSSIEYIEKELAVA